MAKDQILRKLEEFEKRFDKIDKNFDENNKRFDKVDKRFDENNKRFDGIDKRFDENNKRFDGIDKRFVENDRKMDILIKRSLSTDDRFFAVSQEIKESKDEILTVLDKTMVIINRLDQERVFTFSAVKRIQEQQENQQKEITKIKQVLNIK